MSLVSDTNTSIWNTYTEDTVSSGAVNIFNSEGTVRTFVDSFASCTNFHFIPSGLFMERKPIKLYKRVLDI